MAANHSLLESLATYYIVPYQTTYGIYVLKLQFSLTAYFSKARGCGCRLLTQYAFLKTPQNFCIHTYWFNSNFLKVAVHEVSSTFNWTYNLSMCSNHGKSNKIESDCSRNVFLSNKSLFVKRPFKKFSSHLAYSSYRCGTNHRTKINSIFAIKTSSCL